MKQFTLDLMGYASKPILSIYCSFALLDTGADIPVCCLPPKMLKEVFSAEMVLKDQCFNSFGKEIYGDVFRLKMFQVGELIFPNMSIFVVPRESMSGRGGKEPLFYYILSSSMFSGLIYEIDNVRSKLNVTVPDTESTVRNLIIRNVGGNLSVLCTSQI